MTEEETRFECLRIAQKDEVGAADIVAAAKLLYEFVRNVSKDDQSK